MTRGCPFGTIGNEVTENDELIRQDLGLIFEVAKAKIATFFVREKASPRYRLIRQVVAMTWVRRLRQRPEAPLVGRLSGSARLSGGAAPRSTRRERFRIPASQPIISQ